MRSGPGRNPPSGIKILVPATLNSDAVWGHHPPGTKIAASFAKARKGDVYHTGELTEANNERAGRRPDWPQETA